MNQEELLVSEKVGRTPLSEAMLIDLLVYLPVKSLIRFRCVSNYWCALIKSPTFHTRHLKRDSNKILLLKRHLPPHSIEEFHPDADDILSFHDLECPDLLVSPNLCVPFLNDYIDMYCRDQICLFGPCNGIICIQNYEVIVFCNPALREFMLLDPTPFAFPEHHMASNNGSGFGFDANTNDYKVIQFWHITELSDDRVFDDITRIDLYSSRTNSWKLIDVMVPHVSFDPGFDLFFNGACHWNANIHLEGPPPMGVILSFDVSTEVFQQFEFPDNSFHDGMHPSLVVLNQCLAVVRNDKWREEPHLIDIWVMKIYGVEESWTKELVIGPYLFQAPLNCWKDEWLLVETTDMQLAYCALHSNQMNRYQYYGFKRSFRALIYVESLISLNEIILSPKRRTSG